VGAGRTARRLIVALGLLAGLGAAAWLLGLGPEPETASDVPPARPPARVVRPMLAGAAERPDPAPERGPALVPPDPSRPAADRRAAAASVADASEPERAPAALWRLEEPVPGGLPGPGGGLDPVARRLRVDPDLPERLAIGDDFSVVTPDLGDLAATVSAVRRHANGDLGLSAVLTDFDGPYLVTLTRGRGSLFARVSTPAGIWVVEGTGGEAVMRPDPWDRLVDPTRTDERVPPAAREEDAA
jgi:hypothetical protein